MIRVLIGQIWWCWELPRLPRGAGCCVSQHWNSQSPHVRSALDSLPSPLLYFSIQDCQDHWFFFREPWWASLSLVSSCDYTGLGVPCPYFCLWTDIWKMASAISISIFIGLEVEYGFFGAMGEKRDHVNVAPWNPIVRLWGNRSIYAHRLQRKN